MTYIQQPEMAFSRNTRKEILERDGYSCVETGLNKHLEAAHYDHDKTSEYYNDPNNGRTLHRREHYKDHYNREGENGLTPRENQWALRSIWRRLSEHDKHILAEEGYKDPDGNTIIPRQMRLELR